MPVGRASAGLAVQEEAPAGLRAQIAHAVAMMLALLRVFEISGNTVQLNTTTRSG